MSFRSVTAILLAAGLLTGCEDFKRTSYEVQRELGMYPVDPPRAEVPQPAPGTVAQATWAAQRTETLRGSNQSYVPPVGYKEPEQPAAPGTAPVAAAPATPPATATARAPAQPPVATTPRRQPAAQPPMAAAPVPATPNPAAMTAAAPTTSQPSLPAGYTPSASVVDQPKDAAEQQKMAAATGAVPEPPMMSGSMKENVAMMAGAWKAHLASHRTESAAINEWQELLKSNGALYGQFDPLVEWTDTQRGPFARLLLVGFAERKDADAACAKIRSSTRYCASVQ